jgi:hypothetical protein
MYQYIRRKSIWRTNSFLDANVTAKITFADETENNYKNDACFRRYLPKTKRNINTDWVDHKRTQNEISQTYEEAA